MPSIIIFCNKRDWFWDVAYKNNAYRYLTEVSIFTERQRYNYKHESIATLIEFDYPLNMESMVLVNAVWAPDEKKKSWAAVILIANLRIYFN